MTKTRKIRILLCLGVSLLMHGAIASWLIRADLSATVEWNVVHPIKVSLVDNYENISTGKIDGQTEGDLDFASASISQPIAQDSISDHELDSVEPISNEPIASTIDTDVWVEKLLREPEQPGFNHSEENVDFDSTEFAWTETENQEETATETTGEVVSVDETVYEEIGQLGLPDQPKIKHPIDDLDGIRKVKMTQEEPMQLALASNSPAFDVSEPQLEQFTPIERTASEAAESPASSIENNLESHSDIDALEVSWTQIENDQFDEFNLFVVGEQAIVDEGNDRSFEAVDAISDADQLSGIAFEPENHRIISDSVDSVPETGIDLNAQLAGDYESELPSSMMPIAEQLVQVASRVPNLVADNTSQEEPMQFALASNSPEFDVGEPQLEPFTPIEHTANEAAESPASSIENNLENYSDFDALEVAWTQIEYDQLEETISLAVAEEEFADDTINQSFESVDVISDADQLAGIGFEPENHRIILDSVDSVLESEVDLNAQLTGDYESELPSSMMPIAEQLVQVASKEPNVVAANKSQSESSQVAKVLETAKLVEKKQSNPYQPEVSESNTKSPVEEIPLEFANFDRKTPKEYLGSTPSQVNALSQEASLGGTVGLGYSAPEFGEKGLSNPAPRYPYMSRIREEQGRVVLEVHVDSQGKVASIQTLQSSGFSRLDRAAKKAVNKWKFVPASQDGTPTSGVVNVPINFVLKN